MLRNKTRAQSSDSTLSVIPNSKRFSIRVRLEKHQHTTARAALGHMKKNNLLRRYLVQDQLISYEVNLRKAIHEISREEASSM